MKTFFYAVVAHSCRKVTHRAKGAAFGAARLAWLAAHPQVSLETALHQPALEQRIVPDADWVTSYQQQQQEFLMAYQQLKQLFYQRMKQTIK